MHILKKKEFMKKKLPQENLAKHIFLSSRNLILDGSLIWLDNKLLQKIMILPETVQ